MFVVHTERTFLNGKVMTSQGLKRRVTEKEKNLERGRGTHKHKQQATPNVFTIRRVRFNQHKYHNH